MNSPMTVTVGWAPVPTRIQQTNNSTGNSPDHACEPDAEHIRKLSYCIPLKPFV